MRTGFIRPLDQPQVHEPRDCLRARHGAQLSTAIRRDDHEAGLGQRLGRIDMADCAGAGAMGDDDERQRRAGGRRPDGDGDRRNPAAPRSRAFAPPAARA
jgi:hypothetical protein